MRPVIAGSEVQVHNARFASLALLALLGCSSTHEPITATSGVYDLTIASEHDACSPTRPTGALGTAGIVVSGAGTLTVSAPDLTSNAPMLVLLSGEAAYAQERTDMHASCTQASLVRGYSIVSARADGIDIAYAETWRGLSTCSPEMHANMPAAPSADCTAHLVMHYRLATPCASSCQILLGAGGAATCRC